MIPFTGIYLYRVEEDDELPLDLSAKEPVGVSPFWGTRQDQLRLSVEPGTFVIVPCTGEADIEAEFYLRVFTETPSKLNDVPTHVGDLLEEP